MPAELYLNYDCGLYSTNLFEELMKLFAKVCIIYSRLSLRKTCIFSQFSDQYFLKQTNTFPQNASAFMGSMYSLQFISLDAIFMLINGMEVHCKGYKDLCKTSRHLPSEKLPSREQLLVTKANKRVSALLLF